MAVVTDPLFKRSSMNIKRKNNSFAMVAQVSNPCEYPEHESASIATTSK